MVLSAEPGLKPSPHALEVARRTWAALGPQVPHTARLDKAVEAAFAQHLPSDVRRQAGWQGVVTLALVLGFIAFLLVWGFGR